jgi:hypothetical protein
VYCEMRPESRNNHLSDNGSPVSATADNAVNSRTFVAFNTLLRFVATCKTNNNRISEPLDLINFPSAWKLIQSRRFQSQEIFHTAFSRSSMCELL